MRAHCRSQSVRPVARRLPQSQPCAAESRSVRPTPRRRWCGKTNKSLICQKWPRRSDAGTSIVIAKPRECRLVDRNECSEAAALEGSFSQQPIVRHQEPRHSARDTARRSRSALRSLFVSVQSEFGQRAGRRMPEVRWQSLASRRIRSPTCYGDLPHRHRGTLTEHSGCTSERWRIRPPCALPLRNHWIADKRAAEGRARGPHTPY